MAAQIRPEQTGVGYRDDMVPVERAPSAHDVAAELRNRLPRLPTKKLHKLLYYCQGHHLAVFGEPLFSESVMAWDMGPVVGTLWWAERESGPRGRRQDLGERELNTIGYVVSRYGSMSGRDLELLSHHEAPWQRANEGREPGAPARIEPRWLEEWFAGSEPDAPALPPAHAERMRADTAARLREPGVPDDVAALRACLAE